MILLSPSCLANEIDNGPLLFALLEMIQCQCHGFMSPQPTREEHIDLWAGIFKGSRMAAKVRRAGRLDPNHIIVDFDTDLSGVREPPRGSQNQSNNVIRTHLKHILEKRKGQWKVLFAQNTFIAGK
jgi:hypothetical protein